MFDIGLGEILLLAVVGLLVFGPEKLPKAAADAGRMIRQVREMATGARRELVDSAGLDLSEATSAVKELGDLHPRRLMGSLLDDDASARSRPDATGRSGATPGATPPPASPDATGPRPVAFDPDAT